MTRVYSDNPIRDWDKFCSYTSTSEEKYYSKVSSILFNILDDIRLSDTMYDYMTNLVDVYIESDDIDNISKDITSKNVLLGLGNLDSFILEKGYLVDLENLGFDSTDLYSFLNIAKHISEWDKICNFTQVIIDNIIATKIQ